MVQDIILSFYIPNMSTSTKSIKIESLISAFTDPNSVTHRHTPLCTSHTDDRKTIKILLNANMLTSTKPIKIESLISAFTDPNSVTHRHTPLRTSHTDNRKDIKILLNGAGHYSKFLHTKYVNIDQIN
ncbi:hypothetical protein GQR58_000852 [Nymphon striatum]|nr:hypothetical protein GQR58_000852 [Nymphon striatum]